MKQIEKLGVLCAKWLFLIWNMRLTIVIIILVAFTFGRMSFLNDEVPNRINPINENATTQAQDVKPVKKKTSILNGSKIDIKIEQSTCCFNLMVETIIVSTRVNAHSNIFFSGYEEQEHFVNEVHNSLVDKEKDEQMKQALSLKSELETKISKLK